MTAIKEAVTDAVATMKHAEQVIDGLMAVNDRLRREKFAMLEALERLLGEIAHMNALGRTYLPLDIAAHAAEQAVRLAKGEKP